MGQTLASQRQAMGRTDKLLTLPPPHAVVPYRFFGDVLPAPGLVFLWSCGQLGTVSSAVGSLLHCLISFFPLFLLWQSRPCLQLVPLLCPFTSWCSIKDVAMAWYSYRVPKNTLLKKSILNTYKNPFLWQEHGRIPYVFSGHLPPTFPGWKE